MKTAHLLALSFFLAAGLLPCPAKPFCLAAKENDPMKNVARELRDSSRKTRVDKRLSEYIEDRVELLEYGVERGRINADEERKIRKSIDAVKTMRDKMRKTGTLSPNEHKRIMDEINRCYRLIWFADRKDGRFVCNLFGVKYYLRPEYRKRVDRGSLSTEDMRNIMYVVHRVWRLAGRTKDAAPDEERRARIARECGRILLADYFTLEPPPDPIPASGKKKKPSAKDENNKKGVPPK